jgi:hypothetical protein
MVTPLDQIADPELRAARLRAWVLRLSSEYATLLFSYGVRVPLVPIALAPMTGAWGTWDPNRRVITISTHLIEQYPWPVVVEVLKHEVAHQMVTDLYGLTEKHGRTFKLCCDHLCVSPQVRAASGPLPRDIASWREPPEGAETDKLLARAEKLLALAASSNENEASLAMQRVRELYARHNLESAQRTPDFVACTVTLGKQRFEAHESRIVSLLIEHFFVRALFVDSFDPETLRPVKAFELMGTRENVAMAEYVFHFLRNTLDALWRRHRAATGTPARNRRDYLLGVVAGFKSRLMAQGAETAATERALLRVADQRTEAYYRKRHPRIVTRSAGVGLKDPDAYQKGKDAGARLTLHRGVSEAPASRGRLLGSE